MNDNGRELDRVITVAFSMYTDDIATIDSHAKDAGLSRSAGLRDIVREWRDMKARDAGVAVQDGRG